MTIRRNSIQGLPTEPLGLRGKSPALLICQPQPSAVQLFRQNPVLFDQVGDHVLLVAVHPARKRKEQHLKWVEIGSHWRTLSARNPFSEYKLQHDPILGQDAIRSQDMADGASSSPTILGRDSPT